MVDSLCQRYPSLNPFSIRATKAREVFRLIRLIKQSQEYTKEDNSTQTINQSLPKQNNPQRINVTGKRGTGGWI